MDDDEGVSIEAFLAAPLPPPDTSAAEVDRAVRYMEEWLPVGAGSIGLGTVHAVETLMAFARERLHGSEQGGGD